MSYQIRIAWYNREIYTYAYGSWRDLDNIVEDIEWTKKQNKIYPLCHYWVEAKKTEEDIDIMAINIESLGEIVQIKKELNENETVNEYLFL